MRKKKIVQEPVFDSPKFVIFQYPKLEGLRGGRKTYKATRFVSPIFGRSVKDEVVLPYEVDAIGDTTKKFDAFRTKPKLSEPEAIEKYGNKYYEFTNIISNKTRSEVFGTETYVPKHEVEDEKEEKPTLMNPIGKMRTQKAEEPKVVKKPEVKTTRIVNLPPEESIYTEPKIETFKREKPIDKETVKVSNFGFLDEKDKKEIKEAIKVQPENVYQFPPISLFKKKNRDTNDQPEWLLNQIDVINSTLTQFGIEGHVAGSKKGPTVTRYEIELDAGVNVKKILTIKDTLMMNLSAETLRIEAPIPGKKYVGVEVPNELKEIVAFGNVVDTKEFLEDFNHPLKIALGVDIDGQNIYEDIQAMPHGLIAGATNSGKSVCVNTILVSLLLKNTPEDLKLILIDPKMVELAAYANLPHLVTPVITDPKMAASALNWCVEEMEMRYQTFADNRSKDIRSYNDNVKRGFADGSKMPYIVIVIDELADLILAASTDVEQSIQRITQKARAAGIHLLVATQRPTTDVVKGTIKSNIPARIAFKVAAYVDSATILDGAGAETLLGKGDMLLKRADRTHRLQGAYIPDDEIYAVTDFIRKQGEPTYLIQHETLKQSIEIGEVVDENIFRDVAIFVVTEDSASINRIQKEFGLGFNKAQRIMGMLESFGIVSENQGTKAREVIATLADLEELLKKNS